MKKEVIHLQVGRPKTRAIELYSADTPFRPKKIELKTRYKRKEKHPKKDW